MNATPAPPGADVVSFSYLNNLLRSFLGDVSAIRETFELVVPLLEDQDKERLRQYREAQNTLERARNDSKSGSTPVNIPQVIDSTNLIRGHEHRLRRGRILFQGTAIVSLVSRFDQFFAATIRLLLRIRPERLENLSISYVEVMRASSVESLRNQFVRNEVEDLLRKSHEEQFKYLVSFTGPIDEPELWTAFLEITERRNLHVHTGGRASTQYIEACKRVGIALPEWLKKHSYLPIDLVYFRKACLRLSEMAFKIAQTVMRKFFPKKIESADKSLLGIGVDFLQHGQFQLAEMVFQYGVQLSPKWTSGDGVRKTFLINQAIAFKFSGRDQECLSLLKSVDWTSAHAKFLVAVDILETQEKSATARLMALLRSGELTERQIFEWPVFTNYRESESCRAAFREVFGRDLGASVE